MMGWERVSQIAPSVMMLGNIDQALLMVTANCFVVFFVRKAEPCVSKRF